MKTKKELPDFKFTPLVPNDEKSPFDNLIKRMKRLYPKIHDSLIFEKSEFPFEKIKFEDYESAFKLKGTLIKIGFSKERDEYFFVISHNGVSFNSLKETEWCFNFEITAQMACIESAFETLNKNLENEIFNLLEKFEDWHSEKQFEHLKNGTEFTATEMFDFFKPYIIKNITDTTTACR